MPAKTYRLRVNDNDDSGNIRRKLGLSRNRYYQALVVVNTIPDYEIISYLEEVLPNNFYQLNRKEMDYVRNAVFVEEINLEKVRQKELEKEKEIQKLLDFLFN